MKRSLLVAAVLGAAALASSSSMLSAQQQNQPGLPTLARVHVLNREPAEAVPMTVVGQPVVSLTPATVVGTRSARQSWEYRRLTTTLAEDSTPALNAAGLEGWEVVAGTTAGSSLIWTLKRPR